MSASAACLEPFYFGAADRRLFGVYHAPSPDSRRDTDVGVVLCSPIGQEYIRSHRAFLHMAVRLAESGIHVLRFDFSGCGDSAGEFQSCNLSTWDEDLATAVNELREGTGASLMCLCGSRLGGSIAATVDTGRRGLHGLVLWDPVVDGRRYLRELDDRHRQWQRGSFVKRQGWFARRPFREILGFPLSPSLASDLRKLNLLEADLASFERALLVGNVRCKSQRALADRLEALGRPVAVLDFAESPTWVKQGLESVVVPIAVIETVVQWIDQCRR